MFSGNIGQNTWCRLEVPHPVTAPGVGLYYSLQPASSLIFTTINDINQHWALIDRLCRGN